VSQRKFILGEMASSQHGTSEQEALTNRAGEKEDALHSL
jgi:hypothetical protein